jgi:multidrug efflux pump subunit AcrA (membrane-fusion protein)
MTFEVEVDGRLFPVSIERLDHPRRLRVTVGGVARVIEVARPGAFSLSLLIAGTPAGGVIGSGNAGHEKETPGCSAVAMTSCDFQLAPGVSAGELLVGLGGRTISVTVNGRRSAHAEAATHGHGQINIVAPMPGRVVRVLVAAGDQVEARQGVVVVEAMKMENELRAPRAGRVREVSVAPGTPVEAGRVLAVIE